jgi:PRC-barrel domain protein
MLQDYDGATVVDDVGARIGYVERTYVDDGGTVQFVAVKLGSLLAKHRLVPASAARAADNGLIVPYARETIVESPDASKAGDTLEGTLLAQVRAYYAYTDGQNNADEQDGRAGATEDAEETEETEERTGQAGGVAVNASGRRDGQQPTASTPATTAQAGAVRERGDVIEVPIVEEELVKRPVVKEVLRVRKKRVSTPQTVQATLRKENVEVTHEGDAVVQDES